MAVLLPFLLWWLILRVSHISPIIAPGPIETLHYLTAGPESADARAALLAALVQTLPLAGLGLVCGLAAAFVVASLTVVRPAVANAVLPVAMLLQSMPLVALVPLVMLLFGRLSGGGINAGRRAESEQECRKESAMKANVGDWLVIKGTTTERSDQRGLITEVHSADGSPPYVVRWLATGHVATVVPGPDAIVMTPQEQEAADERAQEWAAHRGTNN